LADVLIPARLSDEKKIALKRYLKQRVGIELKRGMQELYEDKIIKWRGAYEAKPREETRQFPFQNASNLVIPLIAIHTDTLHAQIMAAIFKTSPIVWAKIMGEQGSEAQDLKEAYEEYMQYVSIEPQELDLYRVYNEGYRECIKYGTVTFKAPWEEITRDIFIPGGDGSGTASDFLSKTIYSGPRPEKLPFTAFYLPPAAKSLESAEIKCHKRLMLQFELEERKFNKMYDKEAVETVLKSPDRTNPEAEQTQKEADLGATTEPPHQEWDIWECYVTWRYEDESFAPRMIATYHEKSDTLLRVMYDNFESEWFVGARMAHRDDMYYGSGFAETLWQFQEGSSETYNGYRDNQTVANTRVWRVSPDSKLHQGYRIYPSAMLPAEKDEIEALAHGDVSTINLDELRLLLDLAERRSGVSPSQQGFGAGTQTGKRGIYSAMSTLAVMQDSNSRKDLNVSDMRDSHIRLERLMSLQYHVFGKDDPYHKRRLELFGQKAPKIAAALAAIAERKIALPCYSSTASVNKEVEKQNDLMLSQIIARHFQMIAQLLGSTQNMMTPPVVKQYFIEVMVASNLLMKAILKNFGHDEVDRLIPDPVKILAKSEQQQRQLPQGGQPNAQPQNTPPGTQPNAPVVAPGSGGQTIQ
jgi:hypothetical protein